MKIEKHVHTVDFFLHEEDNPEEIFEEILNGNIDPYLLEGDTGADLEDRPGAVYKMRLTVTMEGVENEKK